MEIILYKNLSDSNILNKNLNPIVTISTKVNSDIDILNPGLNFYYDELPDFNYFYIKEFNRYYFVRNFETLEKGHYMLEGHIDVLETYKDLIKTFNVIISEKPKNDYDNSEIIDLATNSQVETKFDCDLIGDSPIFIIFGQTSN